MACGRCCGRGITNLPDPDVLAAEIVEDLEAALAQFESILADLGGEDGD